MVDALANMYDLLAWQFQPLQREQKWCKRRKQLFLVVQVLDSGA
jgi:hypothetical protein